MNLERLHQVHVPPIYSICKWNSVQKQEKWQRFIEITDLNFAS